MCAFLSRRLWTTWKCCANVLVVDLVPDACLFLRTCRLVSFWEQGTLPLSDIFRNTSRSFSLEVTCYESTPCACDAFVFMNSALPRFLTPPRPYSECSCSCLDKILLQTKMVAICSRGWKPFTRQSLESLTSETWPGHMPQIFRGEMEPFCVILRFRSSTNLQIILIFQSHSRTHCQLVQFFFITLLWRIQNWRANLLFGWVEPPVAICFEVSHPEIPDCTFAKLRARKFFDLWTDFARVWRMNDARNKSDLNASFQHAEKLFFPFFAESCGTTCQNKVRDHLWRPLRR